MNTFVKAARHILRTRMIKQAYGTGDEFEVIERSPETYIDTDTVEDLIQGLKWRLKGLKRWSKRPLYFEDADPAYKIYKKYLPDDMALSKYNYHYDDDDNLSEISYKDYINLVNSAIKSKDRKALEDAAEYWSLRRTITNPAARQAIQKALDSRPKNDTPPEGPNVYYDDEGDWAYISPEALAEPGAKDWYRSLGYKID